MALAADLTAVLALPAPEDVGDGILALLAAPKETPKEDVLGPSRFRRRRSSAEGGDDVVLRSARGWAWWEASGAPCRVVGDRLRLSTSPGQTAPPPPTSLCPLTLSADPSVATTLPDGDAPPAGLLLATAAPGPRRGCGVSLPATGSRISKP